MRLICLVLLIAGLIGCKQGGHDRYDRTPNGWHVHWLEQGTITTGLHSKAEILSLFDAAMERSLPECALKVGLPEDYVRATIKDRDALYTIHDDSIFQVAPGSADAPLAVWASGITYGRSYTDVAFYLWVSVDLLLVPSDCPSWTLHTNPNHPEQIIYGTEVDGNQFPALGYELHWQFTNNP